MMISIPRMSAAFLVVVLMSSLLLQQIKAQISEPYALDQDTLGNYYLARVNPVTGTVTQMYPVPGTMGLVSPNTAIFKPTTGEYIFIGWYGSSYFKQTRVNVGTGVTTFGTDNPDNVFHMKYHCGNDTIYCLRENSNIYEFGWMDTDSGQFHSRSILTGVSAHVGETACLNQDSARYSFVGLAGPSINIFEIDLFSGAITNQSSVNANTIGHFYNPNTQEITGLWEDTQNTEYYLANIDPVSGMVSIQSLLSGVEPGYISESYTYNPGNNQFTYRGFDTGSPTIFAIDATSGTVNGSAALGGPLAGIVDSTCSSCLTPSAFFTYTSNLQNYTFSGAGAASAFSWSWDFGDGNTSTQQNPSHSYTMAGDYNVCFTAANNCGSNTYCDSVHITTINVNSQLNENITIYPNPSNGHFFIQNNEFDGMLSDQVSVFDAAGKKADIIYKNEPGTKELLEVEIVNASTGLYLIELKSEKKVTTLKLMVSEQ